MPLTSPRFANNARIQQAAENAPPMRAGERGEAVGILQQALVDTGFPMPGSIVNGKPDGIYGQETTTTVWRFQDREKLSRDGVAGHDTFARLDQLFAAPQPAADLAFEEPFPGSGLDKSSDPPGLLVGVAAHAAVNLRNGDGASVESDNMGVAQAIPGLIPRRIEIFGRSPGGTQVVATKGKSKALLDVVVKKRKVVTLAFFVVTDKNNISPAFSNRRDNLGTKDRMSEIDAMVAHVNGIFRPQTNVVFNVVKKEAINVAQDLDPVKLPAQEQVFESRVHPTAHHTVFFVRSIMINNAPKAFNAVTKIGRQWTLMSNSATSDTLAHEMLHGRACGAFPLNNDPLAMGQLASCNAARTGTKITIAQAGKVNP